MSDSKVIDADVVLVGAGIMSTTLAVFLKELQPHLRIEIIERRPGEAQESSAAWNNAGTGHAANCELNYTPMRKDGSVDIAFPDGPADAEIHRLPTVSLCSCDLLAKRR